MDLGAQNKVGFHPKRSLVPLPAFSSSLSYYDGCAAPPRPANRLQGLCDYFGKLKQFRAITTRYDKTARNFLAAVHLAAALSR